MLDLVSPCLCEVKRAALSKHVFVNTDAQWIPCYACLHLLNGLPAPEAGLVLACCMRSGCPLVTAVRRGPEEAWREKQKLTALKEEWEGRLVVENYRYKPTKVIGKISRSFP